MDYTLQSSYTMFLLEQSREQRKMDRYIQECVVLSEGKNVLPKIRALNEDVGDKIREGWDKFTNFIKRIWSKFVENMTRMLNTDLGYLEKYKDIILGKKLKEVNITMREYNIGLQRIASKSVPVFSTNLLDKIKPEDDKDLTFKKTIIPEYDGKTEFVDYCKAYFQGGEQEKDFNEHSINMTDIYNFCKDKAKIYGNIEKDQKSLLNSTTAAQRELTSRLNDLKNSAKPANEPAKPPEANTQQQNSQQQNSTQTQQSNDQKNADLSNKVGNGVTNANTSFQFGTKGVTSFAEMSTAERNKLKDSDFGLPDERKFPLDNAEHVKSAIHLFGHCPEAKKKQLANRIKVRAAKLGVDVGDDTQVAKYLHESVQNDAYSVVYEQYLTEFEINGKDNKNTTTNTNTANAGAATSSVKANSNKNIDANHDTATQAQSDAKLKGEDVDSLEKKIHIFQTDCSTVITSKMTAVSIIYKDYMKIIRKHVSDYVGTDNSGDNTMAKAGTDYSTKLKDMTDAQKSEIGKLIGTAEKETDETKKLDAQKAVIAYARQVDANFKGNYDAAKQYAGYGQQQQQ